MTWRPASEHVCLEMFEVPCVADITFYGTWGEQCTADVAHDDTIAIEFLPEDRGRVISMLERLLDEMKKAEKARD